MKTESLLAAIERHETLADSYGNLSEERTKALDYYLGNPMGNEVQGRSQVISRDVWDTVEWIKPQLSDIFCGGDQVVMFNPTGPEDVAAAEQETEFVNWVITEKNDWFTVWYSWAHDALLQKTGYVIAYWDEREDRTKEKYEGLTEDEVALLSQDPSVQIVKLEQEEEGFEVELERVKEYGCVKIENVPPERVLVSHNARGLNLQDPRLDFLEYWEYKTISDLRDEGFEVDDDLQDDADSTQQWEESLRDDFNPFRNNEGEESSPAARRLRVRNVWIRYDSNDDGRTELRRVVVVGKTILEDEECDLVTLVAKCPTPLPHQHVGLSVADAVTDLQDIKTALLRGTLDNQYLSNNGRFAIDVNQVNLDDMLVSRPGGVVRVDGPVQNAIAPLIQGNPAMDSVPLMEYVDRISQKRTGVNEQAQGLDPNTLNKTATGAQMLMSAAQQRIKFIARIFAETGVKALFQVVHALTLKHARKAEVVRLRNQWVVVDPRQWVKRADMSIAVGLGAGDKPQQIAFLTQVLQIQQLAMQVGLANPSKIYNALKRLTQAAGYKDPNEFWADPQVEPMPDPGPPPEVLKEQAKAQAQMMIEQGKAQVQLELARQQAQIEMQKLQAQLQLQESNDMRDAERERLKAQFDAQLEQQRLALEEWKAQLQADLGKYTNDQDNNTKLTIAGLNAQTQSQSEQLKIGHDAAQKQADRQSQAELQDMAKKPDKQTGTQIQSMQKALDQVAGALKQLTDMQKQVAEGQKSIEQAVKAKRVLVRGPDGRPSHSEIAQ